MYFKSNKTECVKRKKKQVFQTLLFGLDAEMDHATGVEMLLTGISKLRYAISYDEVKLCEHSVLMDENLPITDVEIAARKGEKCRCG